MPGFDRWDDGPKYSSALDYFTKWTLMPQLGDRDDCWIWIGNRNDKGYGLMTCRYFHGLAHRFSYQHHKGPIPEGLTVHHECHVLARCSRGIYCPHRRCVNPKHLGLLTSQENLALRQDGNRIHGHKTQCPQGHPYSGDNLRIGTQGEYKCRLCQAAHSKATQARLMARSRLQLMGPSHEMD